MKGINEIVLSEILKYRKGVYYETTFNLIINVLFSDKVVSSRFNKRVSDEGKFLELEENNGSRGYVFRPELRIGDNYKRDLRARADKYSRSKDKRVVRLIEDNNYKLACFLWEERGIIK